MGSHYKGRSPYTQYVIEYNGRRLQAADSGAALHLTGLTPSAQHDNVVPPSVTLGSKATVASGCVLGEGCAVGDRASIKRSVLGSGCRCGGVGARARVAGCLRACRRPHRLCSCCCARCWARCLPLPLLLLQLLPVPRPRRWCCVSIGGTRDGGCTRRLGASTKVINSVLQDNVVVGDGCSIQNSILCSGVHVKDKATVKDCQVCGAREWVGKGRVPPSERPGVHGRPSPLEVRGACAVRCTRSLARAPTCAGLRRAAGNARGSAPKGPTFGPRLPFFCHAQIGRGFVLAGGVEYKGELLTMAAT